MTGKPPPPPRGRVLRRVRYAAGQRRAAAAADCTAGGGGGGEEDGGGGLTEDLSVRGGDGPHVRVNCLLEMPLPAHRWPKQAKPPPPRVMLGLSPATRRGLVKTRYTGGLVKTRCTGGPVKTRCTGGRPGLAVAPSRRTARPSRHTARLCRPSRGRGTTRAV